MFVKTNRPHVCLFVAIHVRRLATIREPLPVIKVPKYLKTSLNKVRYKEENRVNQMVKEDNRLNRRPSAALVTNNTTDTTDDDHHLPVIKQFDPNLCIISSNNKKMNHYFGQKYKSLDKIPFISKEWMNGNKTFGQSMRFHIYDKNPSKIVKSLADEDSTVTFESLGLSPNVCDAVKSMSMSEPTAIQMAAIPSILDYKNVICSAETGSGKTIAYLAPIVQLIREFKERASDQTSEYYPKGLVIVPSRELAQQVGRVAQHLGSYCGIGVAIMMGGAPKHIPHTGMDLIVSTLGLVEPLLNKRVYSIKKLNHLVIDESDTLFDDTFGTEIIDLLGSVMVKDNSEDMDSEGTDDDYDGPTPESSTGGVQLVCVSATMPRNLSKTLGKIVNIEDNFDTISTQSLHHVMPHVQHNFDRIHKFSRHLKLLELVKKDVRSGKPVMIFSNRSNSSTWIYNYLNDNGIQCLRLNSDMSDTERRDSLNKFQSGECNAISCTDLGSRGLDTVRVRHVINYDCPHYVSDYIHRSGRTGRIGADQHCLVTTLVSFKPDVMMVKELEYALRLDRPIHSVNANIKQQITKRFETIKDTRHIRAKRKQ